MFRNVMRSSTNKATPESHSIVRLQMLGEKVLGKVEFRFVADMVGRQRI